MTINIHPQPRRVGFSDCRARCAGGHPCSLSDRPHALHVCGDPSCPCHVAAYGIERVGNGDAAVYLRLRRFGVRQP